MRQNVRKQDLSFFQSFRSRQKYIISLFLLGKKCPGQPCQRTGGIQRQSAYRENVIFPGIQSTDRQPFQPDSKYKHQQKCCHKIGNSSDQKCSSKKPSPKQPVSRKSLPDSNPDSDDHCQKNRQNSDHRSHRPGSLNDICNRFGRILIRISQISAKQMLHICDILDPCRLM